MVTAVGIPRATSLAKDGPERTAVCIDFLTITLLENFFHDLGHGLKRGVFDPFYRGYDDGVIFEQGNHLGKHLPQAMRGDNHTHHGRPRTASARLEVG